MCGRYTLAEGHADWEFADLRIEWKGPRRYNIAPSQRAPVIRLEHGLSVVAELRWGLVPSWAKDVKIGYQCINARSETAAEKPAFRSAFKKRRCLVPADGFYEWQALGKLKQPWRFVRPDRRAFVFAGLWESWRDPTQPPEAEPLETFTIITTEPNPVTAPVHDRMPVILEGDGVRQWLAEASTPEQLRGLLRPCAESSLTRYPVAALVGSPKNDTPQCKAHLDTAPVVGQPPRLSASCGRPRPQPDRRGRLSDPEPAGAPVPLPGAVPRCATQCIEPLPERLPCPWQADTA